MRLRLFGRLTAALAGCLVLLLSEVHADWTITTYMANPKITNMGIADQYFSGALPQRFVGTGTVTMVDLFENGGNGQFTINNPFPGLDNMPSAGDTNDYTARVTGTLVVNTAGSYDFFTDSDDGNRFRLDLNQNGLFEDAMESIVPDGGLQGAGTPERSTAYTLAAGNYNFEVSFFELGGGASIDAGYRIENLPTQFVLGNFAGGIGMLAPSDVHVVGGMVGAELTNFALADALRTSPNRPGFPATELRDVFNIMNSGGDADFPGGQDAPGLSPSPPEEDDFLVVGSGFLVVPPGGITEAIFRSNTDDGGRLLIDVNQDGDLTDPMDVVINQDALQGPTNTNSMPVTLAGGLYKIEYSWFERGGGGEGEVSVSLAGGAAGSFRLLGDNAAVGAGMSLEVVVPEPATIALVGLTVLGLAGAVRRRK